MIQLKNLNCIKKLEFKNSKKLKWLALFIKPQLPLLEQLNLIGSASQNVRRPFPWYTI